MALEDSTPQFAKGGNKGKPSEGDTDSIDDVTLVTYTVETVSAPRGLTDKSGVDKEIFAVLETTAPELAEGQQWSDYLGCPHLDRICSRVTIVMTGTSDTAPTWAETFYASAVPIVAECGGTAFETCLHDTGIVNRRRSTLSGGRAIPPLPWKILSQTFVFPDDAETAETFEFSFYWQGQRRASASWTGDDPHTEKIRGKTVEVFDTEQATAWDLFPDLHPQGSAERFFFHLVYQIPATSSTYRQEYYPTLPTAALLAICDAGRCWAEYQGTADSYISSVLWVETASVTITGTTYFEFGVKAQVDDPGDPNPNPQSSGRVMLTHADGTREMLSHEGTRRIDDEDGTAATRYRVDVDSGGCYTFEVVGLTVSETQRESFRVDNRRVWNGSGSGLLKYGCDA